VLLGGLEALVGDEGAGEEDGEADHGEAAVEAFGVGVEADRDGFRAVVGGLGPIGGAVGGGHCKFLWGLGLP
jgi:hypothetical protein